MAVAGGVEAGLLLAEIQTGGLATVQTGMREVAGAPLTLERVLGTLFAPLVFLIGVPWSEAAAAGQLMSLKTALNEVIAYAELAATSGVLSDRTTLMMVYALCGFANVGSLGIVIGGLTALEPSRREDILALTPRALVSGTLATLTSGAAVGLVYA